MAKFVCLYLIEHEKHFAFFRNVWTCTPETLITMNLLQALLSIVYLSHEYYTVYIFSGISIYSCV